MRLTYKNECIVLDIIVVQFEITQIITIFIGNRHTVYTYHSNLRNKRYYNGPRNRLRRTYDTLDGENIIIICYVLGILFINNNRTIFATFEYLRYKKKKILNNKTHNGRVIYRSIYCSTHY